MGMEDMTNHGLKPVRGLQICGTAHVGQRTSCRVVLVRSGGSRWRLCAAIAADYTILPFKNEDPFRCLYGRKLDSFLNC